MSEILYSKDKWTFSYRVAGILIHKHKILLHKPVNEMGFALPGGHVEFGETNEETLKREFMEEIGVDVVVKELKWVGEVFFDWNRRSCHQICLYYEINLADEKQLPMGDVFIGNELMQEHAFEIEFHWIKLDELGNHLVYPENIISLLDNYNSGVQHYVDRRI